MKKSYNAPRTESLELMAQMIMQSSPAGGPTTTGAPIDTNPDNAIDWGN